MGRRGRAALPGHRRAAATQAPCDTVSRVPRLQVKHFDEPDELRRMPRGIGRLVTLDEAVVGLASWEPGWRWSRDLRPIAGGTSCQVRHLGYCISGVLRVTMDDGETADVVAGSVYEIPAGHDAEVISDEPWVTVEWTSGRTVGVPTGASTNRVLATVLFTDIVDSTARLHELGDAAWRDLLHAHNEALRQELSVYRGREIDTTGDGMLAMFDSPTRGVFCGLAMVRACEALGVPIRVGLHTGEVELVGDNVRGVAVHTAARVMATAGASEVVVSATTRDLLDGSGLEMEDAGEHALKGLPGVRRVYRVVPA